MKLIVSLAPLASLASLTSLLSTVVSIPLDTKSSYDLGHSVGDSTQKILTKDQVETSAVPVGSIITQCTVPGTFALTFDDGPYTYTDKILDILKDNGVKATFFVNGQNWGNINEGVNQARVRRAIADGHQIGSHTWAHADLATLDRAGIVSQMNQLSTALRGIIGKAPRYMRSPYFSTSDLALQTLRELNFHVIHASIDTLDWQNDSESAIETSVQLFNDGLDQGGTIELSHDVHQWTANTLVQAMIDELNSRQLRAVTVGECLGDPASAWYS